MSNKELIDRHVTKLVAAIQDVVEDRLTKGDEVGDPMATVREAVKNAILGIIRAEKER